MKAYREGYNPPPFYFLEESRKFSRVVAWHPDAERQRDILLALLKKRGERIEYLFKQATRNESGDPWTRVWGGIFKNDLISVIEKHRKWFFSDGMFQFCVREPDVEDYFAYDDHGTLFLYEYEDDELLESHGLLKEEHPLINDAPHWQKSVKDSAMLMESFVRDLKAASQFFEDEKDAGDA